MIKTTNYELEKPELTDAVGDFPASLSTTLDIVETALTTPTANIKGRKTAGAGKMEDLTAADVRTLLNVADGANAYVHPNHTGDVTSVGDGAQTIAANAVTETKIVNKAVTLAKMADMATESILGRKTAATGVPEVIAKADAKVLLDIDDLETSSSISQDIFGAFWDKGETPTLTRLNSAKGLTFNVGLDSSMVLNEFDTSSLFADFKEVTDAYGNEFIRIPKMYIKKVSDTNYMAWYISRKKFGDAYLPYCFWDFTNGKELDYVDVGKYPASLSSGKLESKSGTYPLVNTNIVNFRTYAQANGTGYQLLDVHTLDLLQVLCLIEFGTLDVQTKCLGYTSGQYSASHVATVSESAVNRIILANAYSDLFAVGQGVSCGTSLGGNQVFTNRTITSIDVYDVDNKAISFDGAAVNITAGNILYNSGYKNGSSVTSGVANIINTSGKHPFVWHGIESLWGNVYQFVDGININEHQAWVCKDAASYASNSFTAPYLQLSYVNGDTNGYVKSLGYDGNLPFANFPTVIGGDQVKYYADYYYQSTGQRIALFGGYWGNRRDAGLFCWRLGYASSNASLDVGGRLVRKAL